VVASFGASVMQTVAVVARKGGSGKTTLAVHLAIAGYLRGVRTLLADADPQRSASEALRGRALAGPKLIETNGPKLFALQEMARRAEHDLLIIDTPCGPEQDVAHAMALADLSLIVVRPTFLDIAAAVRTIDTARRLGRPAQIVINQAYCARAGREPASVQKTFEALRFTGMPVCPEVIRSRAIMQTALTAGRSVEEYGPSRGERDMAALWRHVRLQIFTEHPMLRRA
jgi:chromosome partitioning protein